MRTGAAVLALASVIFLGACGGGGGTPSAPSTPAPTPASRAEVTVSITPASPVAQPSNESTYPWRVDWTLVLKETAGLGGNLDYVDVSFVNNFGFETPSNLNYGADQIIRRAGRNHLDARTNTLKNAVSFTDDRGNQMMLGTSATVVSVELVRF